MSELRELRDECNVLGPIEEHEEAFCHVPEHGFSMFLEQRTKRVHFVRHAEGYHNQAAREFGDETPTIFSTPGSSKYLDARLNANGVEQCKHVRRTQLCDVHPELVVVSPLTRTLETARLLFGADGTQAGAANEGGKGTRPTFLVHDVCRERWGKFTNDMRRPGHVIKAEFGPLFEEAGDEIDFDTFGFQSDEDADWTEERESDESCSARGIALMSWLIKRPERDIAVVTHSSFLRHLFSEFGGNLSRADRNSLQRMAGNAEVRTVMLAAHRGCT